MRWITGLLFAAIALLPYMAMLAGYHENMPAQPRADESLAIISPHRREVRLEYTRGFGEWMRRRHGRNVGITWLDVGGTSKIVKDLESRFTQTPDNPGADLLFGGGVAPFLTAAEQGWLAPIVLPPELLAALPATCAGTPTRDRDNRWYGVAISGFGILYNKPVVERLKLPAPEEWDDLGRPEYFSWVASGDPRSSGSVHMCYEIILQAYGFERGWDLIARISANVRNFGEAGGAAPREVASGEVAAGMVIDQYAQTVIDSVGGGLLVFILPKRMTVIGPDAIAMLKGSRKPDLTRLFVEYVLSADGQRLLYQPRGMNGQVYALHRMPVRADLYREPQAPRADPYAATAGFTYDADTDNMRRKVIDDMIGVCFIDAHADLVRAWRAIIAGGCRPAMLSELGRAPCAGPEEMRQLAATWKDPRVRLETMRRWARDCQARYAALAAGRAPNAF